MANRKHKTFEKAFKDHYGKVFDMEDIQKIIHSVDPKFKIGSIMPTDHAEHDIPRHKGQCPQCADKKYQIFDTLVDGYGKPFVARYRVRMFESFPE